MSRSSKQGVIYVFHTYCILINILLSKRFCIKLEMKSEVTQKINLEREKFSNFKEQFKFGTKLLNFDDKLR